MISFITTVNIARHSIADNACDKALFLKLKMEFYTTLLMSTLLELNANSLVDR